MSHYDINMLVDNSIDISSQTPWGYSYNRPIPSYFGATTMSGLLASRTKHFQDLDFAK